MRPRVNWVGVRSHGMGRKGSFEGISHDVGHGGVITFTENG